MELPGLGLLLGSTIVLYEGAPAHPDLGALFRMADEESLTYFGTSAPFLVACRKAGLQPGKELDLRDPAQRRLDRRAAATRRL